MSSHKGRLDAQNQKHSWSISHLPLSVLIVQNHRMSMLFVKNAKPNSGSNLSTLRISMAIVIEK